MFLIGMFGLGILIVVHELGHFLVAKWYRVGVLEFAVGFGKAVKSVVVGETRYTLRLVPLGGYVRMTGDNPAALEEPKEESVQREATERCNGGDLAGI